MVVDGVARTVALGYIRHKPAAKGTNQGNIQDAGQSESLSVSGSLAKIAAFPIQF
jgi:hypothetical protein